MKNFELISADSEGFQLLTFGETKGYLRRMASYGFTRKRVTNGWHFYGTQGQFLSGLFTSDSI